MRRAFAMWAAVLAASFHFGTLACAQEPNGAAASSSAGVAATKEQTCRVSGVVVKMADGTPLKNAIVQLTSNEDQGHTIAARTGADGTFALINIPAGKYGLVVSRSGYVAAEYGQQKPSDPGAMLSLSPGQEKKSLLFKLMPAAVIAGRVLDEDGEPMQHSQVTAAKEVYNQGRRTLATRAMASTDDLGQFRLFGLAPGRYFVSAMDPQWRNPIGDREFLPASQRGQERGSTKTYYPGTADPAKAAAISVREGEEVPGADIILRVVPVFRVRGRVFNQAAQKGGMGVNLQLSPRVRGQEWSFSRGYAESKPDGTFEFSGVVPGSYTVTALWGNEGSSFSTRERIEVRDSDVEGVTLVLGWGVTISGRVQWEGKPIVDEELSVHLQPTDGAFGYGMGYGAVAKNEEFALKGISDGDYQFWLNGLSKDCYIKDIVYGSTHSADGVIAVKGGAEPLEVIVSSRGARVQGAVVDKDGLPASGVWVVAVPEEAKRSNFRLFKSQTTDQYGKFDLHGLAPGSYQIFSWTGIENGEWQDEEFLKQYERKGESVEVRDDDVKTVNLAVIEKKSERE